MDNLRFAAEDEGVEADKLYPEFAKVAEEEGFCDIAALFRNLVKIEETHKTNLCAFTNFSKKANFINLTPR